MAFFETDTGHSVHYKHFAGDRGTMALVHGWGMSGEYWNSTVEALLANGFGALVIDHRGCGGSDQDFQDLSLGAIAGDVANIVQKTSPGKIVLNGWSLGGAVVVEAAGQLGKVDGLVLTCGATPRYTKSDDFSHGGEASDVLANQDAITAGRADFFRALAQGAVAEGTSAAVVDWLERGFLASGAGASRTLADLAHLDQRELLSSLTCPVLSIGGTKDGIVDPAIARFAAECAKTGRLEMLDTGHSPQLENPEAYHRLVIEFMEQIS